jgi:hypothetical protein
MLAKLQTKTNKFHLVAARVEFYYRKFLEIILFKPNFNQNVVVFLAQRKEEGIVP